MLLRKLLVAFHVEIALVMFVKRNDIADLWSDTGNARFEAADTIARSAIASKLVIEISNGTDEKLLAQELRRAQIEVHIDAVLVSGVGVLKIVGEAERGRELISCLRIEIRV